MLTLHAWFGAESDRRPPTDSEGKQETNHQTRRKGKNPVGKGGDTGNNRKEKDAGKPEGGKLNFNTPSDGECENRFYLFSCKFFTVTKLKLFYVRKRILISYF